MRLLQTFLRAALDPDAEALNAYCRGVEIGFKQRMPRAPAIYKEKTKWRFPYEDVKTPTTEWAANYQTAREGQHILEEKIKEDIVKGRMIKTMYGVTKLAYKDRLHIGALGLVEDVDVV